MEVSTEFGQDAVFEPVELMELEEVSVEDQKYFLWQQQEQQDLFLAPWIPDELPSATPVPATQSMSWTTSMSQLLNEEETSHAGVLPATENPGDSPSSWQHQQQQGGEDAPNLDAFDCLPELSASDVHRFFQLQSSDQLSRPLVVMVMNPPGREAVGGAGGCSHCKNTQAAGKLKPGSDSSSGGRGDLRAVGEECPTEVADAVSSTISVSDSAAGSECGKASMSLASSFPHCPDECEQAAQWILAVHDAVGRDFCSDMPRFKKKPMVHEFFGYILFLGCDGRVPALKGCAHFCRKSGCRVGDQVAKSHFKIVNFAVVAQVWRRLKSNSSNDCIKNLKRAMRMSISNERNYFVDLKQAYHRLHIYKFGERSMSFFYRVFPDWFVSSDRQ